jgi:nitronate monooxygenase
MRKEAGKQNNIDFMSMWAGQTAHLCKSLPAAQLVQEFNDEVIKLLKRSQ